MEDVSAVIFRLQKREGRKGKNNLKDELLQWMDMQVLKEMEPKSWKDTVWITLHRKKSTAYNSVKALDAFGMRILAPVDGGKGDEAWCLEEDFSEIKPQRLLKLLKFVKGATDEAIEEWLYVANNASDEDFKKFVQEKEGKTVCDCIRFIKQEIEVCEDCGKKRKKEVG